ncbi:MAG TPA: HEAT repeat domain-containing protein [Gemmataceae bacterium]|nr:HEAT repeat domain-containing protein [Gemmataceae bacterium]
MLDATGKKLLQLLEPDHPLELRCCAAQVLGTIGTRDVQLATGLCQALRDPEASFRIPVMAAIGQLKIDQALPQLLALIRAGGVEAEVAAQAAARLGAKGIRALQDLMGQVPPGLRRRIASALPAGGTAGAGTATIDVLLDSDPGVVDAAVRSLLGEIASFSAAQRRALVDHVLEIVKPRKGSSLAPPSETALVRLLAALGDPRSAAAFWPRIEPPHPPELRAAALQALGALSPSVDKEKLKRLLDCACDADFRVAAPALMILKTVSVADRALDDWLVLLDAPDPAVRRFALERLADKDTPKVAEALLRQLRHPDPALRNEARARLAETKHGREALAVALRETTSVDEAWTFARAQAPFVRDYPAGLRGKLFSQACTYLEAGDRRADALLFLLREADAAALREQLEARALGLRKKKAYAAALIYWRLLTRDPACGEALRFEMAACGLKVSEHDLAVESRTADPSLQQFARLIHSHDVDPAERLKQAKWLAPEDWFYVGFHFAEGNRQEREFGAQALRLAIQRSPRSKLAKDAKSKLRSTGLA